jgi:hypothetical protein
LTIVAMARHFGAPYIVHLHAGQFDGFWATAGTYFALEYQPIVCG